MRADTRAFNATGSRNLFGILLALASAVTYAIDVLIAKRLLAGVPAGLVAFTIALYIPGPAACVAVIEISSRPTSTSPSRNSVKDSAPAMQPA